jgi:hypothetical protein
LKPTVGNETSHKIINDNWIRVVYFATSKNQVFKTTMLSHLTHINLLGRLLMQRHAIRSTIIS